MARFSNAGQGKKINDSQKWVYAIIILVIAVGILAVVLGIPPFGKSKKTTQQTTDNLKESPAQQQQEEPEQIKTEEQVKETEPVVPPVEPNFSQIPTPAIETDLKAVKLINEAVEALNAQPPDIIKARDKLNDALLLPMSEQQQQTVKAKLSSLADEWLISSKIFTGDRLCGSYKVEPGEILTNIGKKYKVPPEIIQQINKIPRPELLRAESTIKVINGPFNATVHLKSYTMDIYLQNVFVRTFNIGVGQPGMDTPKGLWRVAANGKLIEPPWPDPVSGKVLHAGDPGYALGSRWIGLEGIGENTKKETGYGIHGTKDPETIGTASSRGCVRLHNGDVIFVYNLLEPVHSTVIIED